MLSDCFLIMDQQGLFWTGSEWTRETERALAYPAPADGYERAAQQAAYLRSEGFLCLPFFIPPAVRHSRRSTSTRTKPARE